MAGESQVPGSELPGGGAPWKRRPEDQRGSDPHGLSLRDVVLRAQPHRGGPESRVARSTGGLLGAAKPVAVLGFSEQQRDSTVPRGAGSGC